MSKKTPERLALEAMAQTLGVEFQGNIGNTKLQERIDAAKASNDQKPGQPPAPTPAQAGPAARAEGLGGSSVAHPALRVVGPKAGRWRIGRHFGATPTDLPIDALTQSEIDALNADPMLIVAEIDSAEQVD